MTNLYNDRRTVLLIDQDSRKQKLRATMLRGMEIEVHAADTIDRAESLWRSGTYDLILVAAEQKADDSYLLSARIRLARPDQRIALLVGPPNYIRELPGAARSIRKPNPPAVKQTVVTMPKPAGDDPEVPAQWQQTIQKVVAEWYSAKLAV
jgi:CheY-like chemotaxis protein